jgi:hypothetical protein
MPAKNRRITQQSDISPQASASGAFIPSEPVETRALPTKDRVPICDEIFDVDLCSCAVVDQLLSGLQSATAAYSAKVTELGRSLHGERTNMVELLCEAREARLFVQLCREIYEQHRNGHGCTFGRMPTVKAQPTQASQL